MGLRFTGFGGDDGTGCGCCNSPTDCVTNVCVVRCSGLPVSGASVAIKSGPTTISSGTTGTGGCVSLTIPSGTTYTVAVTASGFNSFSASRALACNRSTTVQLVETTGDKCLCTGADYECSGTGLPGTLTLNDGMGDVTLTYNNPTWVPRGFGNMWTGCAMRPIVGAKYLGPGCAGALLTGGIDVPVLFGFFCTDRFSPSPRYAINLYFYGCSAFGYQNALWLQGQTCDTAVFFPTTPSAGRRVNRSCSASPFIYSEMQVNVPPCTYPITDMCPYYIYGATGTFTVTY